MKSTKKLKTLDDIRSWSKENNFIYPSSEIYGGFAAVYDYGHYGNLLLQNIRAAWQKSVVQERSDVVSLDSAIFTHPKTWEASGHVESFSDVLVEDKKTHKRYRADHLIEDYYEAKKGEKVDMDKVPADELAKIIKEEGIKSPDGNELTAPRSFNLLVKSNVGSTDASFNDENVVYLRGETCQGIYLNYKNVVDNMRVKLPFGIAQIGKAFRNEIVARQFVFRTREFEQMEMQYFIHPEDTEKTYADWKQQRWEWFTNVLEIPEDRLRVLPHEKLAHYASAAEDIQYNFESLGGFKEVEGIHARGDWDLSRHQQFSGQKLDYFDQERNERFIPHIVETSIGLNRTLLMLLEDKLEEEEITNAKGEKDTRTVLRISKTLAPIKVAILPLARKPELKKLAQEIFDKLKSDYMCEYDESGSIGKRYRRQDEIGTPTCITVDFDSLEDDSVTLRDRDTMEQKRVKIEDIEHEL